MLFTALPAGSSPFHFLKLVCIRTSISLPSIFNTQHALALLLIKHTLHHPFPRHPPKCYVIYRTWFFFMGCITFIKGDLQSFAPLSYNPGPTRTCSRGVERHNLSERVYTLKQSRDSRLDKRLYSVSHAGCRYYEEQTGLSYY